MADFKTRVESYAALHKRLAKGPAAQKKNANPDKLTAQKTTLAARIQAARADAKHGDIFTPEVRETFRRLLAPGLKGAGGRDTKAVIKDDAPAPGTVPFKVNAKYPDESAQAHHAGQPAAQAAAVARAAAIPRRRSASAAARHRRGHDDCRLHPECDCDVGRCRGGSHNSIWPPQSPRKNIANKGGQSRVLRSWSRFRDLPSTFCVRRSPIYKNPETQKLDPGDQVSGLAIQLSGVGPSGPPTR